MPTSKVDIAGLDGAVVGTVWQEDDGSWCWRAADRRGFGDRQERKAAIKALMDAHLILSGLPQLPRRVVEDRPRARTVWEQADDILRAQRAKEREIYAGLGLGRLPPDPAPIPD